MKRIAIFSSAVLLLLVSVSVEAAPVVVSQLSPRVEERIRLRRNRIQPRTVRRRVLTNDESTARARPTRLQRGLTRRANRDINSRLPSRITTPRKIRDATPKSARPTTFQRVRIRRFTPISTVGHSKRDRNTTPDQYRPNVQSRFQGTARVSRRTRVQQSRQQNKDFRSRLNARRRQTLNAARKQQSNITTTPQSSLPQVRIRDPFTDTTTKSQLLLLNSISPILGGGQVFSTSEPIEATDIIVLLTTEVPSVSQLLVYSEDAEFLGNAVLDTSISGRKGYRLPLPTGKLTLPYRENFSFYVRARLNNDDSGGTSGENVTIDSLRVDGNGAWSNKPYSQSTSENYLSFQTTRSTVIGIANGGFEEDVLVAGTDREVGSFRFTAQESDSSAQTRLTTLKFTVESFGGVTISNPVLRREGDNNSFGCSIASSIITCSSIPAQFGTIDTAPLKLTVYADIVTPSTSNDQFLRLVLNDPGTISSAGDITWTDGSSTFTWLALDRPVARSTSYKR